MSRVLLAFAFVAALSATTLAANVGFYVAGQEPDVCPTTLLEIPQEQLPAVVPVQVVLDLAAGEVCGGGGLEIAASSDPGLGFANLVFGPNWAAFSAWNPPGYLSLFNMAGVAGPKVCDLVASVDISVPVAPPSTNFVLTANDVASLLVDAIGAPLAGVTFTDLTIHVSPEPATLGLLVLGGLAVLRRRFA